MRRISGFLAVAAILVAIAVGYTYKLRLDRQKARRPASAPQIKVNYDAVADQGWSWNKNDDQTGKPVVKVEAKTFQGTRDPSTFELHQLALKIYRKDADEYTYIKGDLALFDERSGLLKSDSPVTIVMNVPSDKNAEDKAEQAKHVRVITSGITYETKTGKASTDKAASFLFTQGDGSAVGAEYDPNKHELHLKSQVALDWIGKGPVSNKMHIETADLVYKELEQKIYLSPWSKMQRQTTTIQGQSSVVTLDNGILQRIDSEHPFGTDEREDKHTDYSADRMTALFDDNGNMVNIVAENNAKVTSSQPGARTTLTANRADLRFAVEAKQVNGVEADSSDLHLVLADGHAIAQSDPLPQPGVQIAESRYLRSEHIELEMKPGGKDLKEIRTSSQAQLEFKPNRPDQSHRILDASHLRILYGEGSYVDTFLAWNVATHTDKSGEKLKESLPKDGKPPAAPTPALTWSDLMTTKFTPDTNQIATIDQTGNFKYQEGTRKASAAKAFLEQTVNRMTLTTGAQVSDDTGSAMGDTIVMNQLNGDMDASGHVVSTHEPDKKAEPGTSMLDETEPMQAKGDTMQTRNNNSTVHYAGHAVMWQGANRISANVIDVNRDDQTLHAAGNVVSELVDSKSDKNEPSQAANPKTIAPKIAPTSQPPVFTTVQAPELNYRDDSRVALYSGGVKLTRQKMIVTAKQLQAFLTPKSDSNNEGSSLDHAIGDGDVDIFEVIKGSRTRTGTAQHCEYFTKDDKVILNGGIAQMADTKKGVTRGQQLTYFNGDDHLIVEGLKDKLAYTQMKKK